MLSGHIIILGDFNVHVDLPHLPVSHQFLDMVSAAGLHQLVDVPTHNHGHTLDLVISRTDGTVISRCEVLDKSMSDHSIVCCDLNIVKSRYRRVTIISRNYRQIDDETFRGDLSTALDGMPHDDDADSRIEFFHEVIQSVLDCHCLKTVRTIKKMPSVPWYDENIRAARQVKKRAERKWRKSGSPCDRDLYNARRNELNISILNAKCKYYTDLLLDANSKDMYATIKSLLGCSKGALPCCDNNAKLANDFATFFEDKITQIRQSLEESSRVATALSSDDVPDGSVHRQPSLQSGSQSDETLSCFTEVSETEVKRIIQRSANKSCVLDPLPTWLLKANLLPLIPAITSIVNCSLRTGVFPGKLKEAIIRPCLKKPSLDTSEL